LPPCTRKSAIFLKFLPAYFCNLESNTPSIMVVSVIQSQAREKSSLTQSQPIRMLHESVIIFLLCQGRTRKLEPPTDYTTCFQSLDCVMDDQSNHEISFCSLSWLKYHLVTPAFFHWFLEFPWKFFCVNILVYSVFLGWH
jgi:hypothetical protein